MKNYLISVIIPVYNGEMFVEECLRSVLSQTYENLEVIIVDDGSTDSSAEIVKSFVDERIKLIVQNNRGVSSARNVGIDNSKGDYVTFFDADDIAEPCFIERLLDCSLKNECDIVFGNYKFLYDKKTMVKNQRIAPGLYSSRELKSRLIDDGTLSGILFGSVWGSIYKASTIKNNRITFREDLKVNEDGVFNIEMLNIVDNVYVFEEPNYIYRQWKSSTKIERLDSNELDKTTAFLRSSFDFFPSFNLQIKRRMISVFFWTSLKVGRIKNGFFESYKQLKTFAKQRHESFSNYKFINFKELSKQKRFLLFLLRNRLYFLFAFIVRFIVPHFITRKRH